MADVTGAVHVTSGGKRYTLRLTMGGIARLQSEFGRNVGGLLDGSAGDGFPDFNLVLRVVEVALEKGHPELPPERIASIADDILTADQTVLQRILAAAFPDAARAAGGNAAGPSETA